MSQYLYNTVTGCTIMSKKKFIKDMLPIPTESKFILHDTWIALYVSLNAIEKSQEKGQTRLRESSGGICSLVNRTTASFSWEVLLLVV